MITAIAQPLDRLVLVHIQTGPVSFEPHYLAIAQARQLHAALGQCLAILDDGPAAISLDLVEGAQ